MATTAPHAPTAHSVEAFDQIYADAAGNAALIPWADERPHPALVNWLNAVAPSLVRSGSRVCVVGCGLGDDARELMRRGYEVTAFDCSPTAVQWAKDLDPHNARCYYVADLFDPPSRWAGRFDLVVEINTIQSLPPEQRSGAITSIMKLLSRHGRLLVICRGCDEPVELEDGPPWALTENELLDLASHAGLTAISPISSFMDDEDPPVHRIRAAFRRA